MPMISSFLVIRWHRCRPWVDSICAAPPEILGVAGNDRKTVSQRCRCYQPVDYRQRSTLRFRLAGKVAPNRQNAQIKQHDVIALGNGELFEPGVQPVVALPCLEFVLGDAFADFPQAQDADETLGIVLVQPRHHVRIRLRLAGFREHTGVEQAFHKL